MSRIDELIAELCPEGVPFRQLGDVVERNVGGGTPSRSRSDYWGGDVQWASVGDITATSLTVETTRQQITSAGLANSSSNIIPQGWVVVAVKIAPGAMRVVEHDMAINQDIRGLRLTSTVNPYFLAYYFQILNITGNGTIVKGITNKALMKVEVPVPPLEIQLEIVRILDTFSKMEAALEAELEARKQQYEHYRHELLIEAETIGIPTELGQLGRIVTGRTPKASDTLSWGDDIDFITPSDIKNGMKRVSSPARRLSSSGAESLAKAIVPAGSLLVTCIGADMGKTILNVNSCATNQQINSITLNPGIDTDFVFHVLTSMRNKIRAQGERAGGTMPIINKSDFSKIRISLPPLPEQKRIAAILDKFDSLVNDLSSGLPAELSARRQQYEYYRDKLLTFKELEPAS
ncbi:restriction endonuclease subunit S [Glutamicibacter arilaitensis]|uniref:restriction endonuclease subunit S n=1 Tax=Glutamicibacter arilaitensis TaxID=256701 RepID=UPI003A8E0F7E